MGCEGANIKMISDGNTELSKVTIGSDPIKSSVNACYHCKCLLPLHISFIAVVVMS